jgi:hypothetical protein
MVLDVVVNNEVFCNYLWLECILCGFNNAAATEMFDAVAACGDAVLFPG